MMEPEGVSFRVVEVVPRQSWKDDPQVFEEGETDEDGTEEVGSEET